VAERRGAAGVSGRDQGGPPSRLSQAAAEDLARACYRVLLGREPENEGVIKGKSAFSSAEALIADFLASDEYVRRIPPHFARLYPAEPAEIEVDVGPAEREALFARVRRAWSSLGERDPFWSVLTSEAFRAGAMDAEATARFYASGQRTAEAIDVIARRCGVAVPRSGVCIEFGCGVGRVTGHLARRFDKVLALDVSPGNLSICRERLSHEAVGNVETRLISSLADLAALPACDMLFSVIVFQHNTPPVQKAMLEALLPKISPGGAFLLQLATDTPGYRFRLDEYLASESRGLELHCLPMASAMRIIAESGLVPLEVMMDTWTGLYGSHTFFGVKPPG
jgi:trans-aconitate methyltransferase